MLEGILSIGGKPGLFKMISQTKNGLIVESLLDSKRIPAFSSSKISALEDIAIFTEDEDLQLEEVLKKIHEKENGNKCIDHKSANEDLKNYFTEILPDYDKDRVYVSDIKKVLNWYNILQDLDMLKFEEEKKKEDESGNDEKAEAKTEKVEIKAKKKAAPKKHVSGGKTKAYTNKKTTQAAPRTKSK